MQIKNRVILFVDDDRLILNSYKRSAEDFFDEWTVYFASSGAESLGILNQYPVDVLITDIRMAGMDGVDLLEHVSRDFPSTIRLVLSGNLENARMLQVSRLAHQFLAKPCDITQLKIVIERSCHLRDLLSDPQLISITTGVSDLPSLPSLYGKLVKALQSENSSPDMIGDIISQDVSMTAKVLQLVNSAFFGLPGKVSSPQRAAIFLGTNTIKALVLGIHIFSDYQGFSNQYFSIDTLWQHSILVGSIAREIAKISRLDSQTQEDAQIAGMLHDIGKLIQLKIPDFFSRVKVLKGMVQLDSEYQEFGTSHAELGAYLLGIWGLPESVLEAVAFHHHPSRQVEAKFGLVSVLHAANGLYYLENSSDKDEDYADYLDLDYLQKIDQLPHLDDWKMICRKLMMRDDLNELA